MSIWIVPVVLLSVIGGVCLNLWLLSKEKGIDAETLRIAEERLAELQGKLEQSQIVVGRAEELERTNEQQRTQLTQLTEKLEQANQKLQQAEQEKVKVQEQKEALETLQAAQKANIEQLMSEQEKKFIALQEKSQSEFNRMTTESVMALKKQTEEAFTKSRAELQTQNNTLLTPLKDTMTQFSGALETFKENSISRHAELKNALTKTLEMNETLSKEAENLTNALKAPKIQGNWGELTLEEVLTSGGLLEGVGYDKQVYLKSEEGKQYPDFIVHLPQDRHIIIDSKMSINSYVKWCNAATEKERKDYITQHVAAIRKHIDELSTKEYQKQLAKKNLEFVFMFIPIEYAYFAAIKESPDLISYAQNKQVALVTPSNLFAVIQVVSQMWRVERTSKMMDQILKTGATMHKRVVDFVEDMQDIKKHLDSATQSYTKADTHLRGKQGIIKSAQALEELEVTCKNSLAPLLIDEKEFPAQLPTPSEE